LSFSFSFLMKAARRVLSSRLYSVSVRNTREGGQLALKDSQSPETCAIVGFYPADLLLRAAMAWGTGSRSTQDSGGRTPLFCRTSGSDWHVLWQTFGKGYLEVPLRGSPQLIVDGARTSVIPRSTSPRRFPRPRSSRSSPIPITACCFARTARLTLTSS
jgi:hypothetical protein